MSAVSHMALLGRGSSFPPKLDVDQIPTMTAATTSGVTMSASSEFSAAYAAWRAGANNGSTSGWESAGAPSASWLQVAFAAPVYIYSYTILCPASATRATAWTLKGSNTGAFGGEEVTIDTQSGQSPNPVQTYTPAGGPFLYQYYRFNVSGVGVDVGIDELELRQ